MKFYLSKRKSKKEILMGAFDEAFKFSLVEWDRVCSPIAKGVLGISKVGCFNQAFVREMVLDFWD